MPFVPQYIPVTRPLYMRDYAPSFGEEHLDVWVNPPAAFTAQFWELVLQLSQRETELESARKKMMASEESLEAADFMKLQDEHKDWMRETYEPKMYAWFAELWSKNGEVWTAEDARAFFEVDDLTLGLWVRKRCLEMINAFKSLAEKKI